MIRTIVTNGQQLAALRFMFGGRAYRRVLQIIRQQIKAGATDLALCRALMDFWGEHLLLVGPIWANSRVLEQQGADAMSWSMSEAYLQDLQAACLDSYSSQDFPVDSPAAQEAVQKILATISSQTPGLLRTLDSAAATRPDSELPMVTQWGQTALA